MVVVGFRIRFFSDDNHNSTRASKEKARQPISTVMALLWTKSIMRTETLQML